MRKFFAWLKWRRQQGWWKDICTCAHRCEDHYEMVGRCMKCDFCTRFTCAAPSRTDDAA